MTSSFNFPTRTRGWNWTDATACSIVCSFSNPSFSAFRLFFVATVVNPNGSLLVIVRLVFLLAPEARPCCWPRDTTTIQPKREAHDEAAIIVA